jgi:hypothetical protein
MTLCATRMKTHRLAIPALLFLLQLTVVSAQGQNQITHCLTFITAPGDYVLANDLVNCSADGIIIGGNADGVVLHLAGYQITGSSSARRAGIRVQSGAHARIMGPGIIRNYTAGFGILLVSGRVEVTGVTSTGNDVGFYFTGGRAMVHGNIATNNVDGFYMVATGELTDNLASGNSQDGIFTGARERAQFLHNTAVFNGRYGIAADRDSSGKDIISNTALNNLGYDLFDGNRDCQNRWVDNTFGTSKGPCIH